MTAPRNIKVENRDDSKEKSRCGEAELSGGGEETTRGKISEPEEKVSEPERKGEAVPEEAEKSLEELLAEKEKEAKENLEKWLRCQAEFENFKRRQEREKNEFCKFANESIIMDMLPTLDNLDRAIEHSQRDSSLESLLEGVKLTRSSLLSVLEKQGLEPIEAVGKKFDPHFHEAVMQEENDEVEEQTVLREIQKGYLLHGRVVRPSMVVVSKKPSK